MQEVPQSGRAQDAQGPYGLIAARHVIAVKFATIAEVYWR
jgi:hypothetical protein